jgi:hypothetical protein
MGTNDKIQWRGDVSTAFAEVTEQEVDDSL